VRRSSTPASAAGPPAPSHPYTSTDVSRLSGFSLAQVRSFARHGFVQPERGPHGTYQFSFQDLIVLRTAQALAEARIPAPRIRRALRSLKDQLPAGHALTGVRIATDGTEVVAHDGAKVWLPESGQYLFGFDARSLSEVTAARAALAPASSERPAAQDNEPATPDDWFELGDSLEGSSPELALEAYRRAVFHDPGHLLAHAALARVYQRLGRALEAVPHLAACRRLKQQEP